MNAERLYDLLKALSDQEESLKVQETLDQIHTQLQQLASSPQDTGIQTQLVSSLDALKASMATLNVALTPANMEQISQLGGGEFFSTVLSDTITSTIQLNAMTPAAAVTAVRLIQKKRIEFLTRLRETITGLYFLGFDTEFLEGEENAPFISFQLPRALFDNELNAFSKEVRVLDQITRWFSECATGQVESPQLKSLSTSDPTISLTVSVATIVALGGAITWLLNTWKQVLEIKALHQSAKSIGFAEKDLAFFAKKIDDVVSSAIKKHSAELVSNCKAESGRKNEIRSGLDWSMHQLLARIERGMTVEIKFLPRPATEEGGDVEASSDDDFNQTMKRLADGMVFPTPTGEPLLALTGEPERSPKPSTGQ